jgi:hypothetical protein
VGIALALGLVPACTQSEFGAKTFKAANLRDDADGTRRGKSDLSDGDADGPDAGGPDSDSGGSDSGGNDSGGNDSGGGKDSGGSDSGGGKDSGGTDSGGGNDSGGDVDSGDDVGGDSDSGDPDPDDLATADDEVKSKYFHDGTVTRSEHDDPFVLKVETYYKGKVVETNTLNFDDKGEAKEGTTLKLACRTKKNTCLKLTFTGKGSGGIEQVHGAATCTKTLSSDDTSAYIHADTNGGDGCLPKGSTSDDEGIHITCPDTKKLEVENCD